MTPRDTEIFFSEAFRIGAIAAMALPPQIAVPVEIRCVLCLWRLSDLPMSHPVIKVKLMDAIVRISPS